MKLQDRKRDAWLLSQRDKKAKLRRQFHCYETHHNRFGNQPLPGENRKRPAKKPPRPRAEIKLPERLDLDTNYDETVTQLTFVRSASERRFRLGYLNFDGIRTVSSSAALVLASEIDRWKESIGGKLTARHESWDPDVKQLLCQMGLFELLELERPGSMKDVSNTIFLPFMRGNVDERTNGGALAKKLRQQIDKIAGTEIKKHLLFDGLTEAITNVCQHAYRKQRKRKRRYRPWWMSAAFSRDTNTVTVSFYDHGLTIPGTLPASEKMERWRHRMGFWDDGQKIRAAMTVGRSATGKAGRGKGLRNFLELINGHSVSKLRIISKQGQLTVEHSGSGRLLFRTTVLETCLRGTLIEWQFAPETATDNLIENEHLHS